MACGAHNVPKPTATTGLDPAQRHAFADHLVHFSKGAIQADTSCSNTAMWGQRLGAPMLALADQKRNAASTVFGSRPGVQHR